MPLSTYTYQLIVLEWGFTPEQVGTHHVSDHVPRFNTFSSDVSMERIYRLSFCRNYKALHQGV